MPKGDVIAQLRDCLRVVTDDLEAEIVGRYGSGPRDVHPAMKRRLDRDMEIINDARKLLDSIEDDPYEQMDIEDALPGSTEDYER